jgi:hypothetical protein
MEITQGIVRIQVVLDEYPISLPIRFPSWRVPSGRSSVTPIDCRFCGLLAEIPDGRKASDWSSGGCILGMKHGGSRAKTVLVGSLCT